MSRNRTLKIASAAFVAIFAMFTGWVVVTAPAISAAICPSCFGFTKLADGIFVEAEMSSQTRRVLLSSVESAKATVLEQFGRLSRQPTILACATEICDRRTGGRGAKAVTHSYPGGSILRLSPRGLDRTIVTHEWVHVEVHARIGIMNQFQGAVPAWFDEGLAVIISEDERYLRPGSDAAQRCAAPAEQGLPASPFQWGPLAGKTPVIYAKAACAVMHWLEANGGKAGLLMALDQVAQGRRHLP